MSIDPPIPNALVSHIDTWIFDLDNTLYPASCDLFALIDVRIGAYVQRLLDCDAVEAHRVQKSYFREHGTTLSGLIAAHGTDPYEFLGDVHDISLDRLSPDPHLAVAIARLPGRKLIFTNGDVPHATRVLARLGMDGLFDGIHDIHAMNYHPKPMPSSYTAFCDRWHVDANRAFFAEDMARNLPPAKALGMTTLWIDNGSEQASDSDFAKDIDFTVANLGDWLTTLTTETA